MKNVWEVELLKREEISASLDGKIAYILPIASSEVLGGVQPIQKTEEMNQQVGVDEKGRLWFAKPDVEGFVSFQEKQGLTEEQKAQARTNIGAIDESSMPIKVFPHNVTYSSWAIGTDVFQLEGNCTYIWDQNTTGKQGNFFAVAEDGTIKTISTISSKSIYQVLVSPSQVQITGNNCKYIISTADKSTAGSISVTYEYNTDYLGLGNREYTPTRDYNPATKKYVDEAVKTVDVSEAVFITVEDIDEICDNVVEGD